MDHFQSGTTNTTVLYFPLIEQKFIRKNEIVQLTNGRCDQAEIDTVLDHIESECGHFELKQRMLGRNRLCLSIFILCFVSGLTTVMISTGVNTSIGFYVGIGIVTLALLLVLLILLINRMLNKVEMHYLQVIQARLELSNEKIEKSGAQWNTRTINLNYLELRVIEDDLVIKQMFGTIFRSKRPNDIIEESKSFDQGDRNRGAKNAKLRKARTQKTVGSDEGTPSNSDSEESDDEDDEDDEEGDEDIAEEDEEDEEDSSEEGSGNEVGNQKK